MSREIVLAVDIEADHANVFEALTTREGLAAFWTPEVEGTTEAGGELQFGFEPAPVDLVMRVEALEPDERVAWSCPGPWPGWEGTSVEWRITDGLQGASGSRVVLVHDGWADDHPDAELGSVAYTWALVLGALKGYAETGKAQPALR